MKKNTKVQLTQKWWKDNKAKTLIGKGGLGKTLGNFEGAFKLAAASKGAEQAKRIKVALKLCDALDVAAKKNAKACLPKVHSDTQHVLENSFPTEVEKARQALVKLYKALQKKLLGMTFAEVLKDKTFLVLYVAMAKKRFVSENINFILAAKKKNQAVYDEFIREGASQQINIDHGLRVEFDHAVRDGTLSAAPWSKAVGACVSLINTNDMGVKFSKFVLEEA